ncbi:MAG TPA: glycosyltransferase family 2 protein [Acidimicrobiia bacterium]|nr:glycosyltransferase family 2 protein [Acidimicrobiia bacterium]
MGGELRGTVVVCTFNRAPVLRQCLRSLDTQICDGDELEILVVDNGSRDGTRGVLRDWAVADARRRWIREPRVGLSHARNAGLRASDRDVVLFIDDDALAPPTWASAHLRAHRLGSGIGVVGGPVGLVWPYGRPDWMTGSLQQWFSAVDLGDDSGPYPDGHEPYGTNMSMRRQPALAVGGFDVRFGRRGRRLLSSEERELNRRLVAAGWGLFYAPDAAVVQQVLTERLQRRWLLRRGWSQGISDARYDTVGRARPRRALAGDAVRELRIAGRCSLRRPPADDSRLGSVVLALAHLGAAAELARSSIVAPGPGSE